METLPTLEEVDMESGVSVLLCAVAADGALNDCGATPEATTAARKAMPDLTTQFIAPSRAVDGHLVSEGVIAIPFDWSKITPVVRKLKRP
jgi:hypothetical protein